MFLKKVQVINRHFILHLLQMWSKSFEIFREPVVDLFPKDTEVINIEDCLDPWHPSKGLFFQKLAATSNYYLDTMYPPNFCKYCQNHFTLLQIAILRKFLRIYKNQDYFTFFGLVVLSLKSSFMQLKVKFPLWR